MFTGSAGAERRRSSGLGHVNGGATKPERRMEESQRMARNLQPQERERGVLPWTLVCFHAVIHQMYWATTMCHAQDMAENTRDKFLPSGIMGKHWKVLCREATQFHYIFKRSLWPLCEEWVGGDKGTSGQNVATVRVQWWWLRLGWWQREWWVRGGVCIYLKFPVPGSSSSWDPSTSCPWIHPGFPLFPPPECFSCFG